MIKWKIDIFAYYEIENFLDLLSLWEGGKGAAGKKNGNGSQEFRVAILPEIFTKTKQFLRFNRQKKTDKNDKNFPF